MSDVQYPPPPPPPPPQATWAVPPPPPPPPGMQFDFGKPFTYVFDDPNWIPKILLGGLFYLAGFFIIGWFFVLGYMAQTARNIVKGDPLPLPDWQDLGRFFNEGLRLFAVALVYILPFIVIALAFMIPAGILSDMGDGDLAAFGSGLSGCMGCLLFPLGLLVLLFLPASLLFAAVEERFSAAFEFGRIWPFITNNIGNYLLAIVVYLIARFIGGFGVILLCIGVIFTGFWALLITAHAFAQVYRLAGRR